MTAVEASENTYTVFPESDEADYQFVLHLRDLTASLCTNMPVVHQHGFPVVVYRHRHRLFGDYAVLAASMTREEQQEIDAFEAASLEAWGIDDE